LALANADQKFIAQSVALLIVPPNSSLQLSLL